MSFIGAAAAVLSTTGAVGIGTTMLAGAMMGGAVTIGTNLIQGNDPFDNIGQGLLIGGIGGAFSPAANAATGAATAGEGAALTTAAEGTAAASAKNWAALDTMAGVPAGGTYGLEPAAQAFGFNDQWAGAAPRVSLPPAETTVKQMADMDAARKLAEYNRLAPAAPAAAAPTLTPGIKAAGAPSPEFTTDPFGYLTHKDNRGTALLGGLGVAGAMGAFDPKTGLNLPPRTYEVANTTYNPGTVNPNFGKPGQPYFLGQGYGPMTRETRTVAAGGGIRSLSRGGETAPYVPMTARGFMTNKESIPDSADDSASFKRYLKSDINKDEEKGQAAIDKTVMAWLERHAKSDIKGMAEGGLSNAPAPYQRPQYQMSDFTNSPLFQPTQQPQQQGIAEYIANMNQYTPPAPAVAPTPAVANTTSPTLYDPATQRYSDNSNYVKPVADLVAEVDDGGGNDDQNGGDKAGGPIKSRRYAMGGLAALPEYAAGGQLLSGDGDGMSDSIPAVIKGKRPQRAALADGEFVIPADVVSHLGNGSTKAGGKRLYEMMATIRKARTGNSKQGKQINPMKFIPA
jgi:hypothetical protein